MKGDFTRNTFDPRKQFTRVLMQQGRVQLDADWNEQAAILLHYLQTLAADLIGPHGGPAGAWGFEITYTDKDDLEIGPGRYYVDGILCEHALARDEDGNLLPFLYESQPGFPFPDVPALEDGEAYLIYLDVWERHVTYIEDHTIREVALGGPDTATRAQVVWQVKAVPVELEEAGGEGEGRNEDLIKELKQKLEDLQGDLRDAKDAGNEAIIPELEAEIREIRLTLRDLQAEGEMREEVRCEKELRERLAGLGKLTRARLRARAYVESPPEDPCIMPPEASYRGAENQLYRVEIHRGGAAGDKDDPATFKWSRDNGSVVAAWVGQEGDDLIVSGVRDRARGFAAGQWVELTDDEIELRGQPGIMARVVKAEGDRVTIDPETTTDAVDWNPRLKHPKVRRWDHQASAAVVLSSGAVPIREGKWLELEDGVKIRFEPDRRYQSGDYWLIPARLATGDVEWPQERDEDGKLKRDRKGNPIPQALPPQGIEHHYAPLAVIEVTADGIELKQDCRRAFRPLGRPGRT